MNKTEILLAVRHYAEGALEKSFTPGKTYIPPSGPRLYPEDITTLSKAVLDLWFTEWKYSEEFKRNLSKYVGYRPSVTLCNSGSSASLLAITAACEFYGGNRPYVITCATTFPTTITPIYKNGKVPIYIDIDPLTMKPKLDQLEEMLWQVRQETCGIFLGHNLGFPYDEETILHSMHERMWFIADCCDALGARLDGLHVGQYADISILSFFPAHHITTGEGGAVLCQDDKLHSIVESLSNWGRSCYCKPGQQNTCGHRFDWSDLGGLPPGWDHKYIFDRPGYNLKMTDLQAALGLSQLNHINDFVDARRDNYWKMWEALQGNSWIMLIPPQEDFSPFGLPILVDKDAPFTANEMIRYLEDHKVGTRRVFAGNITRQPGFCNLPHLKADLSGSDTVMYQMFWVSCSPSLTDEMIDYILSVINDFLEKQ